MNETPATPTQPARSFGTSARRFALAGVLAGGVLAGAVGISFAQEAPDTKPTEPTQPAHPGQDKGGFVDGMKDERGRRGHEFGPDAVRGEFVVKKADGGFRRVATQRGEVTEVSKASLTVKSEDGFSRTYALTEQSLVKAGRDGLGSVEKGDQVHVFADVADDKATAIRVIDATTMKEHREHWGAEGRDRRGPRGERAPAPAPSGEAEPAA